jgi:hypothetical protein
MPDRVLYYALGGGLGHLVRAAAFLRQQGWTDRALVLNASPHQADPRILGAIPSLAVPTDLAQDIDRFRDWLSAVVIREQPALICVDCFPGGIRGELCELAALDGIRLWHLARLLQWPRYAELLRGPAPHYEQSWRLEPLHAPHEAFLQAHSAAVQDYQTIDSKPNEHLHAAPEMPFWLVLHSGPEVEVQELTDYAVQMRQIEGSPLPIVIASPQPPARLPPGCVVIDQHPATTLIEAAERIVSAAGFNVIHETRRFRHKQVVLPFWRRFDDQFERARRVQPQLWKSPARIEVGGTR